MLYKDLSFFPSNLNYINIIIIKCQIETGNGIFNISRLLIHCSIIYHCRSYADCLSKQRNIFLCGCLKAGP